MKPSPEPYQRVARELAEMHRQAAAHYEAIAKAPDAYAGRLAVIKAIAGMSDMPKQMTALNTKFEKSLEVFG